MKQNGTPLQTVSKRLRLLLHKNCQQIKKLTDSMNGTFFSVDKKGGYIGH